MWSESSQCGHKLIQLQFVKNWSKRRGRVKPVKSSMVDFILYMSKHSNTQSGRVEGRGFPQNSCLICWVASRNQIKSLCVRTFRQNFRETHNSFEVHHRWWGMGIHVQSSDKVTVLTVTVHYNCIRGQSDKYNAVWSAWWLSIIGITHIP